MLPAPVNATPPAEYRPETVAQALAAYHAHQQRTGRGNLSFTSCAKVFLRRWPDVRAWENEPLPVQLAATSGTRPFITFLLVTGRINPRWDYLVHRKFSSIWRDLPATVIGADIETFITAARATGFSERVASAMASQVMARVLFATGKRLTHVDHTDFDALSAAGADRQALTGRTWKHLSDITEWDWPEAPTRTLMYSSDNPRLPQPLPRFLPPDADRRLTEALQASPNRLTADALLLQRACGLRIGELLDLELDAVIDVAQAGSWLKVPLGKLDTERMVPIDSEILTLLDRITTTRTPGRPIPHPRTGKPADFLFTAHGRRLGQAGLRHELNRAATTAGLGHITPHQLRHTYATALVNAGVSLQALMAILGHVSAEMSLRYGRLFDTTIRAEYERALDLAKARIGALPALPTHNDDTPAPDWRTTPTIKTALSGGHCLRAPAQGHCTYANICEHCPSYHVTAHDIPVLTRQRDNATTLAADATRRGWDSETERHLRLITRINDLINDATRPTAT